MIIKVKEPQTPEIEMLRPEHILFTYLHLAADPAQTVGLMKSGCTAIAYETIQVRDGSLPLLVPMSEVAGKMSTQVGPTALKNTVVVRGSFLEVFLEQLEEKSLLLAVESLVQTQLKSPWEWVQMSQQLMFQQNAWPNLMTFLKID